MKPALHEQDIAWTPVKFLLSVQPSETRKFSAFAISSTEAYLQEVLTVFFQVLDYEFPRVGLYADVPDTKPMLQPNQLQK